MCIKNIVENIEYKNTDLQSSSCFNNQFIFDVLIVTFDAVIQHNSKKKRVFFC